jgi:hypothetical protein
VCGGAVRAVCDIPRSLEIRLFFVLDCFTFTDMGSL